MPPFLFLPQNEVRIIVESVLTSSRTEHKFGNETTWFVCELYWSLVVSLICTCLFFLWYVFFKDKYLLVFREARWYIGLGDPESAVLPEQFKFLETCLSLLVILTLSFLNLYKLLSQSEDFFFAIKAK